MTLIDMRARVRFELERRDYPDLIKHEIDEVAVFRRMER